MQQVNYNVQHTEPPLVYSIKIVPKKKKDYSIKRLHNITKKFQTIKDFEMAVVDVCSEKLSLENFGYIEPGHGAKGKQRWLISNEDLNDMYVAHEGKKEILLWCCVEQGQKRRANSPSTDAEAPKRSRYDKQLDKITEVEEIEQTLEKKHSDSPYSAEQLRSWAHLIQMKRHDSYDSPPNKPFFRIPSRKTSSRKTDPDARIESPDTGITVSPGKRVQLRGQCVNQLLQLHELLERGGISKQRYEEMQGTIMDEVKKY
jgi:hypothetical protein